MNDDRRRAPQFSFGADPRADEREDARPRGRRTLVWVLLAAGLAAGAAAYYHFNPDQVRAVLSNTPLELPSTTTRAYKWRDADGSWQLTDSPPPAGTPYETITVRSDTNILPPSPSSRQ